MSKVNHWIITRIKELMQNLHQIYFDKTKSNEVKILGIILFSLGIILFLNPLSSANKLGSILVFFAIYIFLFFPEKRIDSDTEIYIFLFLTGWLTIMTLITINSDLDIFFFSNVLGLLIVKEFANVKPPLKKKLSILTLVFFSLSIMIVAEKVISVLNI